MSSPLSCCVCLEDVHRGDSVVVLRPCRHSSFHVSCIEEVLARDARYRCPLCRTKVRELHYEIDSIIEHRTTIVPSDCGTRSSRRVRRIRQYRVVWKGLPISDAEWIDEDSLRGHARHLLREYQESDAMNMIDLISEQAREDAVDLTR